MIFSILLIAVITAISTSLLGVFLVVRKMSMLTDAISHTVLLGIVFGYLIVSDLNSPVLILMATLMGVFTSYLIELLVKAKKASEDAATGAVFSLLFSIAVIIISISFRTVHLDIDAVLLGNLELQIFDPLILFNYNLGPKSLYIMLTVLILNLVFVVIFYKELKIVSFDINLSIALGISPLIIHYGLMFLVSLTVVSAFNAVGSILVISLMIGPPITALLFTKDLKKTIIYAIIIAIINSVIGYFVALYFDVIISGVIASITLITFLLVLLINPKKGIIVLIIKRRRQKRDFNVLTLLIHVKNHQKQFLKYKIDEKNYLNLLKTITKNDKYLNIAIINEYLVIENEYLKLTNLGLNKIVEGLEINS